MVAANDAINHETGYGHEHEKKKASERHYLPLALSYEIRQGRLAGGSALNVGGSTPQLAHYRVLGGVRFNEGTASWLSVFPQRVQGK